jgi:hypothetical protein
MKELRMRILVIPAMAVMAVFGALGPASAATRSPAPVRAATPAESVYTFSEVGVNLGDLDAEFALYATYSETQIWINGKVECGSTQGWVVSWCSNTNNGKAYLNVGMNLTNPYGSWYERMNIYANNSGCNIWGSSQLTVDFWECEVALSSNSASRASALRPAPAAQRGITRIATLHLATGTVYEWHLAADSVYEQTGRAVTSFPGA